MPEKAELYKLIVETTNEGVWIKSADHTTSFVNQKMASMLGYTVDEMLGKSFYNFIHEADINEIEQRHDLRISGQSEGYELALISKTGDVVWTHINASPFFENGIFIGSIGMVSDITEFKAEELLREKSERNYRSLFENSPVPTWDENFSAVKTYIDHLKTNGINDVRAYFTSNPDAIRECLELLIVNDVNTAVVELNEAPSKEYLLNNFRSLSDSRSPEHAIMQFESIANGDKSCSFDAELITFNKNVRHVHLKWTVVDGYEDTYEKVYLSTTDVTKRILSENQRLKSSNAQKELLLKEIHHRVKNNLQIITSLLRLQSNSVEDVSVSDLFELSLHRINSMAFVHDMLYQSKDFSHIDFQPYLDTLLESLIASLKPPGLTIDLNIEAGNIQLNINTSISVGLIVNEVITNSIKHGFTDCETGNIQISITPEENNGFCLEISDNGNGFELTSDIESIETLGLQLIYSLIDQLNGTIHKLDNVKGTHYEIRFNELKQNSDLVD